MNTFFKKLVIKTIQIIKTIIRHLSVMRKSRKLKMLTGNVYFFHFCKFARMLFIIIISLKFMNIIIAGLFNK